MLLSVLQFIRTFTRKLREDSISAYASQAAFFTILSVFPFLMCLLTMLNYLPISADELQLLSDDVFPTAVSEVIRSVLTELSAKASGTVLSVTIIAAFWSASRGVLALSRGLNAVYRREENRNYFVLRFICTLYTLVFAVLLIVTLLLLVFGNQLYLFLSGHFPLIGTFVMALINTRTLLTMAVLTLFFLLIYMVIPNHKSHIRRELPGALFAAAGWLLFSYLFSFYIDHFGNFSYLYGSLTVLAICMLWLYFCMYILFLGAELNLLLLDIKNH